MQAFIVPHSADQSWSSYCKGVTLRFWIWQRGFWPSARLWWISCEKGLNVLLIITFEDKAFCIIETVWMIVAYQSKIKTAENLLDADNCKLDSCNYHWSSYSNHITIHQSVCLKKIKICIFIKLWRDVGAAPSTKLYPPLSFNSIMYCTCITGALSNTHRC